MGKRYLSVYLGIPGGSAVGKKKIALEKCLFSSLAHLFDWVIYFSGVELEELLVYF